MVTGSNHKGLVVVIINWVHANSTIRIKSNILFLIQLQSMYSRRNRVIVVLLWSQNWRENLVGVVHSLNHQQGCLHVIPHSSHHLNDHPADQLESKTKRNWHSRKHSHHVIGTEKQIKGQKELEARDPQDLLDSERRSLSKRERAPNLRHPEGIDEKDQVVGGAVLGVDRDEGNDDEHVETDKEAG